MRPILSRRTFASPPPLAPVVEGPIVTAVGDVAVVNGDTYAGASPEIRAQIDAACALMQDQLDANRRARSLPSATSPRAVAVPIEKPALVRMAETCDAILALLRARLPLNDAVDPTAVADDDSTNRNN